MTLGERIKEKRNQLNLSQEKIAELVGTSRQAVTKWEAGQSVPCMENLMALAEIFGVSLEELTRGGDGNATEEVTDAKPHKPPLLLDIVFALVAVFAAWSILKIPSLLEFSVVGFFMITVQLAAILYVPVYLFLIRPWRMKHIQAKELEGRAVIFNRTFWAAGAAGALFICFLLCRHIFYELYGNRDWPIAMFVLGLAVIIVAAFPGAKKAMVCTVAGYVISFMVGIVFNYEREIVNNGIVVERNYTAWWIWTASFLTAIAAGVVWEVVSRHFLRKK